MSIINSLNQDSATMFMISKPLKVHETMVKQKEEHKTYLKHIALEMLNEARRKEEEKRDVSKKGDKERFHAKLEEKKRVEEL